MSRVRIPLIAHLFLFIFFMTTFEAILLGIIQGLTEFLPVSSSGHLALSQYLLGFQNLDQYVLFNLVCHLGTLFALSLIFKNEIFSALFKDTVRFRQVVLGTLPLFPLVLIIKPIKELFDQPQYLGFFFLITAFLLYLSVRNLRVVSDNIKQNNRWRDAVVIGLFQAVAILPGVSRSGATISAGRLLGWQKNDAITFSFLLAIPAILGGVIVESMHLFRATSLPEIGFKPYLFGFLTSFVIGYYALKLLMRIAAKEKFIYFVWYCAILGIATLFYFNF